VLENERSLLITVTLDARGIGADGKLTLLQFKSAVRVVAVAALHRTFQHFMVKGLHELRLRLRVAAQTQLRFTCFQSEGRRSVRSFERNIGYEARRAGFLVIIDRGVRAVTFGTSDIIPPVFAPTKTVVTLFARMTAQT